MEKPKSYGGFIYVKHSLTFFFFLFFLVIITTQSRSAQAGPENRSSYWVDLSRYLAGMPVSSDSPFYPLTSDRAYKLHVKRMDRFWDIVDRETVSKMVPWQKKQLNQKNNNRPVFYPLSGADFINSYLLFPHSRLYIMAALEEPGIIPSIPGMKRNRIANGLLSVQRAVYLYGKNNYFQTKVMIRELKRYTIKGTTPLILIFMARLGLKPVSVESIYIDTDGSIKKQEKGKENIIPGRIRGSRIRFAVQGNPSLKTLYYFQMKLDKTTVNPDTPSGKFFNKLQNVNTVIKAGCYIFHMNQFREVTDFIIAKSKMIIQDDSGIPYRFFNKSIWNMKHFGVYIPRYPISDTKVYRQNDLIAEYRKVKNPLPFNFGYGSLLGKNRSNLLFAEKKDKK